MAFTYVLFDRTLEMFPTSASSDFGFSYFCKGVS